MSRKLPQIYLARHGETAWALTGQHTGRTDIPLTDRGERNARSLAGRLRGLTFAAVFASPLQRARRTCELAGFGSVARTAPDLMEWDYGVYEGLTTDDVRKERPDWTLMRDGCPGGETIEEVNARAGRVVDGLRALTGDVLLFSHGHFLRFLACRWLDLPPADARCFLLSTASLSILGYEHGPDEPAVRLWNDDRHVEL
ncbi:histidine phosphatase family protein [Fimbriiglobus ruber]|nr:histidine phosphatase family protein [Fimbriiglobus ruber]